MGIINWMQNRLSAKQDKRRTEAASAMSMSSSARSRGGESCRQEARDEKIAGDHLLSIGTLGNESPPPAPAATAAEEASAAQDVADFTIEEVKKLQEALNKLLRRAKSKSGSRRGSTADHDADDRSSSSLLPLDRFLNCPSSLEVDRRLSLRHAAADGGGQNGEFSPDTQIILSKARDLLVNTNGGAIKQRSFKFLLKKMFVCRGGFSPSPAAPTLKDPVESRIEKLFRTMLHKRMNARPSNAAASSSRKYYLEDKPREKMQREHLHDDHEDDDENGEDIFKWDKTDSDFIVLEM
uniref:NGR2 n=1 Tax=Oryza punctata TaxID=4537 RepID=A0A0E0LN99_ORYPU